MHVSYKHLSLLLISTLLLIACTVNDTSTKYTQHSSDSRTKSFIKRDEFRHPNKTLSFFEIESDQTVVEIWPGGGWYTEILAPYLKLKGTYYAAHFNPESDIKFFTKMRAKFDQKLKSEADVYQHTITTSFEPPQKIDIAPEGTSDRVLTFRNVHNWMRSSSEQAAFNGFYKALKPGGLLGVVEHRAPESFSIEKMISSGYVSESYIKKLATNAGFVFHGSSELNANHKDTKDHPKGVWTLPPSLRLGEKNKTTYIAIGESDRMTLKFRKPL